MAAKIITVFNQKGGCGKTVVSMHVAGTLGLRGFKTLLIDCDSQGTALRWSSQAPDGRPFPAAVSNLSASGGKVHREARNFAPDYDFIVIDCPPAIESPAPSSALLISDLALIPVVPAPSDMWASVAAKELVLKAREINELLPARAVLNMFQRSSNVARDTAEVLAEDVEVPTTAASLGLRSAFRDCQLLGSTAHRVKGSKEAVREAEALCDEILALLGCPMAPAHSTKE